MKRLIAILSLAIFTTNAVKSQIILSNDSTVCGTFGYNLEALSSVLSGVNGDDVHSAVIPIGFSFNFYGTDYTQLLISGNGYITFNLSQAGLYSTYAINQAIPNPGSIPENAIMAPWHDINPNTGGSVTYTTAGAAPNRIFIATWCAVPMYSCVSLLHTSQIILYEGSNKIEMFIKNKPLCSTWNSGAAVQGLVSPNSTNWDIVTDPTIGTARNFPLQWTTTNEGWEFLPNSPATSYTISQVQYVPIIAGTVNWYSDPAFTNLVGTGPSLPINNTTFNNITNIYTYYAQVTGSCFPGVMTDSVEITFDAACCDFAGDDNTIDVCDTGTPFDMITVLNNSPDPGGVWQDASGNTITNMFDPTTDPAGVYSYIITANGSCIADTGFVTINLINISTLSVSPSTICSSDSGVVLSANLGGGVFNGINVISPDTFNPILIGNNTITYTVGGCPTPVDIMVVQSPSVLTQNISLPACPGESTGAANIIATGGSGFIFNWFGQNNLTLPQGTFNYTVTNSDGCEYADNVTIYDPPQNTVILTTYNSSCYGENNGAIDLEIIPPPIPPGTVSTLAYCGSSPSTNPIFANAISSSIIEEVILNGDNNDINNSTPGAADFYEDYTATMFADITEGLPYSVSVTLNAIGATPSTQNYSGSKIYIDYNIDGDFTDAGEEVGVVPYTNPSTVGLPYVINFTVPTTGVYGPTRMRVVSQFIGGASPTSSGIGPCDFAGNGLGTPWHGATEDYSIVLNSAQITSNILWSNNSTSDSIAELSPGPYSVVITSNTGCTIKDSTIVSEPSEIIINTTITQISCNGDDDGTITANISGGNGGPYTYDWIDLNTGLSIGATVSATGLSAGDYRLIVSDPSTITPDNLTACSNDILIPLSEPAYFSVDFTTSSNEICLNDSIQLEFDFNQGGIAPFTIAYTENASIQPNLNISNLGNTSVYVSPALGSNIYNIDSITDSEGCINQNIITQQSVDVNPLPDINITFDPNPICVGENSNIVFSAPTGEAPYHVDYSIDNISTFDTVAIGGLTLPLNNQTNTTTYKLSFVSDKNGCESILTDEATLIANENPEATFTAPDETCDGDVTQLEFSFTKGSPPWTVNYSVNGAPASSPPFSNPISSISMSPSSQTVYNIDSIVDNNNCVVNINDALIVNTNPLPEINLSGGGSICDDGSTADIIFTATSGTPPYNLTYSVGINSQTDLIDSTLIITTNQGGLYTIKSLTDAKGCEAILISGTAHVNVNPVPEAIIFAYPQPANIINSKITFNDLSVGHANGIWDLADGNTEATNFDKIYHTYSDTGTFYVSLSIESDSGCTDIAWQKIIISPAFTIYIPTAFTPNNDLKNDYFLPIIDGVVSYEFSIYTRSGQKIFTTNEYANDYYSCINNNNCTAAWDGKTNNGVEYAPNGTYIYRLALTDFKGKSKTYEGSFTLIR